MACTHGDHAILNFVLEKLKQSGDYDHQRIEREIINGKFDKSKSTPLMRACIHGNLEVVKVLVERYNVDVSEVNINDENCLLAAIRKRRP